MAKKTIPKPWRVADLTFVEIEIARPADSQMRVEFGCGLRVVIAVEAHDPAYAHTRERNRLTILYHDRTGVCVLTKRLETGTSAPSSSRPPAGPQATAGTTRPGSCQGVAFTPLTPHP